MHTQNKPTLPVHVLLPKSQCGKLRCVDAELQIYWCD
jgi:hypothetical protein